MKYKLLILGMIGYSSMINITWAINYGLRFEELSPDLSDTPDKHLETLLFFRSWPNSIQDLKFVSDRHGHLGSGEYGDAYLYSDGRVYKVPRGSTRPWATAEVTADRWNFFYHNAYDGEFSHYANAKPFPLKVYQNGPDDLVEENILSTPFVRGNPPLGDNWQVEFAAEVAELKTYFNKMGQEMGDIDDWDNFILAIGPKSNRRRLLVIDFDLVFYKKRGISSASDIWYHHNGAGNHSSFRCTN